MKWGIGFAADRCSVATIQLPNSGPLFASEKHRFPCRPVLVGEIPEQTGADVEQKLKTMSGGELERPGGVPRGARSRGPQFTPRQRFATFALCLQPFAWEFGDGAPVCSENDAFRERNGDLNFRNGAPVCSENGASFRRDSDPNGNHRFAAKRVS